MKLKPQKKATVYCMWCVPFPALFFGTFGTARFGTNDVSG